MKNLKKLRMEKGLSQAAFARQIHASQNTISQWEKGIRQPNNDILQKLAEFFGVSIDYLLGRTADPTSSQNDKEFQKFEYALYNEAKCLSAEDKDRLLEYAKILRKASSKE